MQPARRTGSSEVVQGVREGSRAERVRLVGKPLAGPVLIVAVVLAVLHGFAFSGLMSYQYPDVLPFWLPTYCLLGRTLAAGHIPAWNPHVMAGIPFAADPQSGWIYLPAMVLFSALGCGAALRWFVVLQPLLAGLGMYGFLRSEGVSRVACTVGGLSLGMVLAGSYLLLNLPFAGTLAWTPLLLLFASRYLRARTWPGRLGWLAAAALAWMQIAAANLSDGLVLGTGVLALFLVARTVDSVVRDRQRLRLALLLLALPIVVFPAVGLAYFLPRLAYLPRTSIGLGYAHLASLSARLTHDRTSGLVFGGGTGPVWPVRLEVSPGAYLGALSLALSLSWWRARRHLALGLGLAAWGGLSFVLMLDWTGRLLAAHFPHSRIVSFYLHDPSRFRFGLLVALAGCAALGVEGWLDARHSWERAALLVPGLLVWGLAPQLLGAPGPSPVLWFGIAGGAAALALAAWRPGLAVIVPLVLAVELAWNGLAAQLPGYRAPPDIGRLGVPGQPIDTLTAPTTRVDEFLDPTPIALALRRSDRGRYLSLDAVAWDPRGYHVHERRISWGLLGMQQSMVFGLEEAQGYNPAQLLDYWMLVRAADPKPIRYNAGFFVRPAPVVYDLLQVAWVVAPTDHPPPVPAAPVLTDRPWTLFRLPSTPPRASVVPSWQVAGSALAAVESVVSPGFRPEEQVLVDRAPTIAQTLPAGAAIPPPGGRAGTAIYRSLGPQAARVAVDSSRPAIVVIRNSFDPNWHATVDGRPAPMLRADAVLQAVAVPAGRHTILLTYDDPTIGYGLLGSGAALLALAAASLALRRRSAPG